MVREKALRTKDIYVLAKDGLIAEERPLVCGDFGTAWDEFAVEGVALRGDDLCEEVVEGWVDAETFVDCGLWVGGGVSGDI